MADLPSNRLVCFGGVVVVAAGALCAGSWPTLSNAQADDEPAAAASFEEGAEPRSGAEADSGPVEPESESEAEAEAEAEADSLKEESATKPEAEKVAVSFRNVEITALARFYLDQLGKPALIDEQVANTRVTIFANEKVPLDRAMELIGNALRARGVLVAEGPHQVEFLPLSAVGRIDRRRVGPDESVADLANMSEFVDKTFELKHYDVGQLRDVLMPLLPEHAMMLADSNTRRLTVTAAAAELGRIEELVERLDVPSADGVIERIFRIEKGDASAIVSTVQLIISGSLGVEATGLLDAGGGGQNGRSGGRQSGREGGRGRNDGDSGPSVVSVERGETPILLRADVGRNWVIAVASPRVMDQIERWVKELDQPAADEGQDRPYVLIDVEHADIDEVATQVQEAVAAMPDADIARSVRVIPFPKSRQLLVYGGQRGRNLVQSLLAELDVEASQYQLIREFSLVNGQADDIAGKIDALFGEEQESGGFWRRRSSAESPKVKVSADAARNSVTVLTDPQRMGRIETMIYEQWDRPLDFGAVSPRVYTLAHSDPVQVQELLESMFTTTRTSTSGAWWERSEETTQPVGPLFGQFSFEALRGSDKLIVTAKSTDSYVVIDDLIKDIDQPQEAGLPVLIELKHANAEDVSQQLNAMFAEAGTLAQLPRTERGLTRALRSSTRTNSGNGNNQNNNGNNNQNGNNNDNDDPGQIRFWWSQSRPRVDEQPTSNLIGKPRFVPVNRRNAIMVLAPRPHLEPLRALISELDLPGSQVVISAIITEVVHDDTSSLGLRLASDPSLFNESGLADQSLGGGVDLDFTETFGSGRGILGANLDVNLLLQLLIRKVDLRILNEPRVYTADNQEAHFFDGQDVPTVVNDFVRGDSDDGNITRSFEYQPVGTRLHVRPHITQEGDIDLEVNLELSRIESGETVFGNFIFTRRETTTQVTLKDGQTVVVSGIVRQEDFEDVRKLPLFGDIPLVGGLFRSTSRGIRNREVIAFITPRIVNASSRDAENLSERNAEWLDRIRGTMQGVGEEGDAQAARTMPLEDLRRRPTPVADPEAEGTPLPDASEGLQPPSPGPRREVEQVSR